MHEVWLGALCSNTDQKHSTLALGTGKAPSHVAVTNLELHSMPHPFPLNVPSLGYSLQFVLSVLCVYGCVLYSKYQDKVSVILESLDTDTIHLDCFRDAVLVLL